ncbi:MAG: hypothetical protein VX015_04440 [Planctomycetota bacterium]|nr:hypothetical protein [Planctomycetota bacterium]
MKKTPFLLAAVVVASPAFAQNDECTGALALAANAPTAFDTTAATPSAPAWPCAAGGGPDIWYSYTTSGIENIQVSTCNNATYDTAIEIFSGDCANLIALICNDDGAGCTGFTSTASASNIPAGTDLFIRIGGFNGAVGTGTVTLSSTPGGGGPGGDECSGAVPLVNGVSQSYDTTTASSSIPAWPCAAGGGSDIWYSYTTTALSDVAVETCGSSYDTAIEIFSGDCTALVPLVCNDDACGLQSTATAFGVPAGTELRIRVGGFNGSSGPGTVLLTEGAPFDCSVQPDDSFEDNDTCQTAAALTTGIYQGLFCSLTDSDFYEVSLGATDILNFNILDTPNEDLDLNLYDSSCNLINFFDTDGLSYPASGTAQTVIVEVFVDPNFAGVGCLNYDIDMSVAPDPCSTLGTDAFEENDDCASAVPLSDGSYPGLTVFDADNDYFAVTVPDGGTLDASILFLNANGDVDLYLWDPLVACDTNVAGPGGGSGSLALGFSATDDETITYTNTTGGPQNLILEVDMFSSGGCNSYDLNVTGAGVSTGPIGTNYCTSNANSTGNAASISGFGLTRVSANDVTLTASNLPANQFGILIVSANRGFVPGAGGTSNGNLCLGGAIGRYVGPGEILSSGGAGEFSLSIDLGLIPQGGGTTATVAGDTWNFQAWYRDGVGLGSNFTDGIEIVFTN